MRHNAPYNIPRDTGNQTKLAEARIMMGFTQTQVAEKIGTSQRALSFWEAGKTFPTIQMYKKLAELYGCKIDDLVD